MAGVGLGGFFNGDPNPNPFTEILPPGGALLGSNGEPIVDDPTIDANGFADDEGYDPPTGNGLSTASFSVEQSPSKIPFPVGKLRNEVDYGTSKLEQLKYIEEEIRDLLWTRKKLLRELKTERDEIDMRLNVSDSVTNALDEMFPEEPEFQPEKEEK